MQSNITFKKMWKGPTVLSFSLFLLFAFSLNGAKAQTTLTTTYTVNRTNGLITFNFTNSNAFPVRITKISSVINLPAGGKADVSAYFNTSAISGNPGPISAANGWAQFLGGLGITAIGDGTPQPFGTANLTVPAGSTYGIAVNAFVSGTGDISNAGAPALAYSNVTSPATVTAGGCTFTTGRNVGWGGAGVPNAPVTNARAFVGSITFVTDSACSGTPAPGNTISSVSSSCPASNFILSAQNNPAVTGLTYQWQSSSAMGGPFVNIAGATGSFYTANLTANTYYLVIVTCGTSSTSSVPVLVSLSAICYCAAGSTDNNPANEKISNVSFSNVNQSSTSGSGYESFVNDTAKVIAGATYPLSITLSNGFATDQTLVWIDFNQNGSFTDPGDLVYTSAIGGPFTGNIIIPASAKLGLTRMRVRLHDTGGASPNSSPCGNSDFGQVEDYTVNIIPCIPITFTTQPTAQSVACQGTASFTASVNATGSFPVYQWQFRTSSTGVFQNVPNTFPYSGVNTNTLTINPVTPAMSGYEYRLSISGTCTASNPSNTVTLTVTPLIASVTPATTTICLGTIQQLKINNQDAPLAYTKSANSGPIALAIPDQAPSPGPYDFTGVNTTVNVAGIPAGAVITGMSVNLNMTHTFSSDIIFVLKAPNGNIFNLDYYMGAQGPSGANLVNTNISSAGTVELKNGSAPWTGIFKPDARLVGTARIPSGPNGFLPTVSDFSGLYSTPNGAYTLAMYDYGNGDMGTLTSWSVTLDYLLGSSSNGVFTGPVGTIFTDATATTPYTGTPVNAVFVKPTSTGTFNYAVVVSNAICTTDTLRIPISVNSPAGGSPSLTNTSVCAGGNTFLKLGGTLTGGPGFVHNFQVKVPGATSFTNITAGGVYSFNGDALILSGVPLSFNGYQFRDSISTGANCGSVISTVATLTVNPIPVVTISAAPRRNLFPGLTTTLTAAVSSATGTITYQWFRNNVPVQGATKNTLVVGIDGLGTYTVRATAQGCSSADSTTTPQTITIGDSTGVTKLFIYPSPNNGKFQVRYFSDINNGSKNPAMLNVYDERGVRVFSKYYGISSGYQQMDVDLGAHSSGIYRVDLLDLNGDRIKTGSVIVL